MSENLTEAQRAFDYATYKQPADKIRQNLSKIYNNPASSAKRWVWELIQNAKDIPNKFGKVSIEIELVSENELIFRHNGNPFRINNIIGLIRQVSSKDSLNNDEETTGKFGTGFICTHILSEVIDIEGVLEYEGHRKFDLCLDRSGRSSEELIPRIKAVETRFYEPEKNFNVINEYESNRKEEDFDTSFTYHLTTVEKHESAKNGIVDLVYTLPITLVTQSKKIKQVRVIDRVKNTDVVYICNSTPLDENVKLSVVNIDNVQKYYLTYTTSEVALTIEVVLTEDGYTLVKRDSKQPVLYRDFPLIGSEKFYFPYTLNGFRLYPTEKRDSIPLNGEDNYEAQDNREIIDNAVAAAIRFNQWLINHNAKNRYLLASSRRPLVEVDYDERVALPWIKELQSSWRKQLLQQELAETADGNFALEEISVPSFVGYGEANAKTTNESFFNLLEGFYLGRGHLPMKEHLQGWLDVLRPEYAVWESDLKYEKEDFLTDLEDVKSVTTLCTTLHKNREDVITWLNDVYKFLIDQNCLTEFDNYAIIPNIEGDFCYLKDLWSDASDPIPAKLMDLYNHVMTATLQSKLVDKDINVSVFGNTMQVFALSSMVDWFNTKIKSQDTYSVDNKSHYANCWLSYSLVELFPKNIEDEAYLSYRRKLYDLSAVDGNQDAYEPIDVSNKELWREADAYWFSHNYLKIEEKGNVEKLSKEYFDKEKSAEDTLVWLNDYFKFYRDNSKGDFIKDKKIFPTQRLVFKSLNDLRYDSGVDDAYKDLAEYAEKIDFSQEKYRHILLHPAITGYEQHNPLTIKEVYEFVKGVFDTSSGIIQEVIAKHAIAIIAKPAEDDQTISSEQKLYDFAKCIFGENIPEVTYVTQTTGFNWGFAQEFYLRKLCKEISESTNLDGLKNLSTDFAELDNKGLTEWVDTLIEFLHSFKNKKYWSIITDNEKGFGIWLNQNNDFCRFQDVRKDNNVPEEIKKLAYDNKYVSYDFWQDMFTLNSAYDSYLETTPIELKEVGEYIDNQIQAYEGNKQDKDFAALIFAVGKLCSSIPHLLEYMNYYREKKNALIVGSLEEGDTLDLVGSIIQHGDEKLRAVKDILEGNTIEDIELVKGVLNACPSDKLDSVKEFIAKITNGETPDIGGDTPTGGEDRVVPIFVPETFEIEVEDFNGETRLVKIDQVQYAGLSLEEIERYVEEAKGAVVKYFRELNAANPELGLQFDNERIAKHSYSQLYGIMDKHGNDIPIVVHSYKGPQYRYFDLNWYDWNLLSQKGSMLFVLTVTGLQCIPLYALPVRNFNISISNEMNNENRAALLTLAAVGKKYSTLSFDFGNNMPHGFVDPLPFDYVPDELSKCISSIKEVCDQNIPQIANMYNYGKNIPLVRSQVGYSLAMKEIADDMPARDIFDAPVNETKAPSVGTTFID